ncbi:MAG: hypothetical protein ACFFCS_00200 [Candidatus Hodarchaeota archaeon]
MSNSNSKKQNLKPLQIQTLGLGEVKPLGWLKDQLKVQLNGLSGNLDKFWPDIMHSQWIGGKEEGWERFPYWLDGVIPLAYLLDDSDMIARLDKYITYILDHQQENGWFGPEQYGINPKKDPWPNFVLTKALIQYFQVKKDVRIINALLKYLEHLKGSLDEYKLQSWAHYRWMDGAWGIHWLIDYLSGEGMEKVDDPVGKIEMLLEVSSKLRKQGFNWKVHFKNFYYKYFDRAGILGVIYRDAPFDVDDEDMDDEFEFKTCDHRSHVVNNAMGLKAFTAWYRQSGEESDKNAILEGIKALDEHHGQVTGVFTGDEHFAGKNPSQGTELCSVAEYMFSLETCIPVILDVTLVDRLEKICFNALPATLTPDMWAHQYDQQVNQVQAKIVKDRVYTTNGSESNLYGLEPNYGCCTANFNQGWPKFVSGGLWGKDTDGIVALSYSPSKVKTRIPGISRDVKITEETTYPFGELVEFTINLQEPCEFSIKFRIPSWSRKATLQAGSEEPIECASGGFIPVKREWNDGDKVSLKLPMNIETETRYNGSISVLRGPLVFSLNMKENWKRLPPMKAIKRLVDNPSITLPEQVADWEVYPDSPWNYALLEKSISGAEIETLETKSPIFSPENAPIKLKVQGAKVNNWGLEHENAAAPPRNPVVDVEKIEDIVLIPYGCTNIRITEFPVFTKN